MNKQQILQAEKQFLTQWKQSEDDLELFLKYLSIQVVKGDLIKARQLLIGFLDRNWARAEVINKLLPVAVQEEQYNAALDVYAKYEEKYGTASLAQEVILAVGYANEKLKRLETAIKIYESLPNNDKAKMALAHAYRYIGQQNKAIAQYKELIEKGSVYTPNAYWSLSNLKSYQFNDKEIIDMLVWQEKNYSHKEKYFIDFALGYAFEKKGEYEKSFKHYQRGNQAKSGQYNILKHREFTDKMETQFSDQILCKTDNLKPIPFRPVFIVGMPRSGSTLVEQILSSHSEIERLGELPYINQLLWEFEKESKSIYPLNLSKLTSALKNKYRGKYIQLCSKHLQGKPLVITDKNPNNFEHVGFIKSIFPEAKIIDTRREFRANAFSLYRQLFIRGQEYSYSFSTILEYYKDYLRLMSLWERQFEVDIRLVKYESLVNNFEAEVKALINFVGVAFESDCLEFYKNKQTVDTASSEQVRQPIYKGALEQWKNYKKFLPSYILESNL